MSSLLFQAYCVLYWEGNEGEHITWQDILFKIWFSTLSLPLILVLPSGQNSYNLLPILEGLSYLPLVFFSPSPLLTVSHMFHDSSSGGFLSLLTSFSKHGAQSWIQYSSTAEQSRTITPCDLCAVLLLKQPKFATLLSSFCSCIRVFLD